MVTGKKHRQHAQKTVTTQLNSALIKRAKNLTGTSYFTAYTQLAVYHTQTKLKQSAQIKSKKCGECSKNREIIDGGICSTDDWILSIFTVE